MQISLVVNRTKSNPSCLKKWQHVILFLLCSQIAFIQSSFSNKKNSDPVLVGWLGFFIKVDIIGNTSGCKAQQGNQSPEMPQMQGDVSSRGFAVCYRGTHQAPTLTKIIES